MSSLTSPALVTLADKVIVAARPALERLALFTTDFTDDAAKPGDTLKIDVLAGSAADYNASSNNYTNATGTIKQAAIQFNVHKKLTLGLDDKDALTGENLSARMAQFAAYAGGQVGKALIAAALGKLVYTARDSAVSSFSVTKANMANLRSSAISAGFDPADCVVLLAPTAYATLLSLFDASVFGSVGPVRDAAIGNLYGFKAVIEAPNAPVQSGESSGSAVNKGVGFIVPADALAIGGRVIPHKAGRTCVEFGTQTDEVSGMTLGVLYTADQSTATEYVTVEGLFGAALTKQSSNGAPGFIQLVSA